MAYAGSTSNTVSEGYDVFMSFRGEDTRTGFISHLYEALTQNDIKTYKDDKTLEIGRPIASELLKAIETSRIAIVVLSTNFATSKWCLDEIAKIADCMKQGKLTVIPTFYHVPPSDVRHQSNTFGQGFSNYEVDPKIAPEVVESWRAAFREVGAIAGWHVTQDRNEAEVVNEIVRKVLRDMKDTTTIDVANNLVGIEPRVDDVKRILRMESSEVLFIGICGMSGIGRNKDLVKDILTDIGLYPECGITDLINKFLITINIEDSVWMHDLLQQMCWEIIHKESHKYDGKHIAIKYHKDIIDMLSSKLKGMQTVEIINQEPYKSPVNDCFVDPKCFSKMRKLKFLRINSDVHFPKGLKYLSNDLRILEWHGCSLKSLPSKFKPKHIYELEMCSSQLRTLWKKDLELPNLRSINLSLSKDLIKLPDLTSATNLVKLNLEGCTNLKKLHKSVLLKKRLRYLNLKGCARLQNLGGGCMEMDDLEALLLSGCSKLDYIPEFGNKMKRLEHLYVDGTRIRKLPEKLGEMCDLRNLDASGTFIKEIPSSILRLKKLRLLHINRCHLSFKTGGFFNMSLDALSSHLREVDLSYCNLSVVPDDIGLLCHLITLDLSGNEFVSLPASIGLLSKLRTLYLDDCKKLQSLTKLSIVDDDNMDYGPRNRFKYYVSAKRIDVSKFHASSYNNSPIVSCLNCPKLAGKERSSYLAEKILNSYLQLRAKYWMTPEAVFELVGAGSDIPSAFVHPGSGGLIHEGPWIGVAICAVISVHYIDGYTEAKYMVTAHIRIREKHWSIPVPINFLVAQSETQLLFYWTVADDLQRVVGSSEQINFGVSFSVQPEVGKSICVNGYLPGCSYAHYIAACQFDMNLNYHTRKIVDFILDYGRKKHSMDDIYQITKGLLEINQEFFGELGVLKREMNKEYIYCYYVISLGASVLYYDFIRSLKGINDGWLSVELALEQILVNSITGNYSYKEMLQHLNDLEAAHSVGFSDNFITLFLSICRRTFDILYYLDTADAQLLEMKELAKESNITIAGVMCMMVVHTGDFVLLKEMKGTPLDSLWLRLFKAFTDKIQYFTDDGWFRMRGTYFNYELQISDFYDNRILLQELMIKMRNCSSDCFTEENEKEMVSVIVKLQNNINKVSSTIQKMNSHADQYSYAIGKEKKHVMSFSRLSEDDDIISMLPSFNKS
ncbi:hypothetical protein L1987_80581 [Smallanthus sonchifolius]|uniref:Uncharacterized protein n=1 Tax=Smallanthus sonchifolius TaxID=185202 RepID=A0ACB8YNN7_9ASTR|nr:hypothetical protein L1987_80581 [Smallanthus sonchifolius]